MIFSDMGILQTALSSSVMRKKMMEYVPESLQKISYIITKQQRLDPILTLKTYLEPYQNLTKTAFSGLCIYIGKTAAYRGVLRGFRGSQVHRF